MSDSTDLEIQRAIGRLEEAVRALTKEVQDGNTRYALHDSMIDDRVTKLEAWRVYTVAFASGCSATITLMCVFIWRLLSVVKP